MNRRLKVMTPLLVLESWSWSAAGQNPPPPRGEGEERRGGGENPYDYRPQPDRRPLGPGGVGGGPMSPGAMQVEAMRGWLDLIERYARMSRDPVNAGIAAVVGANDVLRKGPPDKAIEYFTKLLDEAKNDAVQRTIRLHLVELYNRTNQPEKALEQLRALAVGVPAVNAAPPAERK